jgi:DNA-binding PadR family transcriptional regulator
MLSNNYLKGTLQTLILRLLADRGQMYGYQIIKELKATSNNLLHIKEAALYPALHKLEDQGFLAVEQREVSGRLRKYYRLSPKGKKAASEQGQELSAFVSVLQKFLKPV